MPVDSFSVLDISVDLMLSKPSIGFIVVFAY